MHSSSETRLSLPIRGTESQADGQRPTSHTRARQPSVGLNAQHEHHTVPGAASLSRNPVFPISPCVQYARILHTSQTMLHAPRLPPPSIRTPSFSSSCTMHKTDIGIVLLCSSTPHDTECVNSSCPNVVRNPPKKGESKREKKPPSPLLELPPPAELKKLCAALGEGGNVRAAKSKARPVPVPVVV
jgi:hypothetical protein